MNGKLVDKQDAKVSVYDHGLLYGDGVFEGIRVYGGKVFRHKEHVDRLWESAQAIALTIPLTKEQVTAAVGETVRANNKVDGYIRLIVTRGPGTLGLDPRKCEPWVIVIVGMPATVPANVTRPAATARTVCPTRPGRSMPRWPGP